jgi:amidase
MFEKPTVAQLRASATALGMHPSDDYLAAVERIVTPLAAAYRVLDEEDAPPPPPRYPRDAGYRPDAAENPLGAWYVKTDIHGRDGGPLAGRRVALKDNVCLAGVPMMIGASVLEGFVPSVDATVVERILDAGGIVAGKAVCEYFCVSGGSHTSATGPVHNPHKHGHSAGGSSSGSAALVAAGEVDFAIGGDQAGSIRIPASHCGIVGMKPTFGLVPYTGISGLEPTIDHTGPMTRTVAENALFLEVLAGPDGLDHRQAGMPAPVRYTEALDGGAKGLRIGVVTEGFGHANTEPAVDAAVRRAAERLARLGATVEAVSVPEHRRLGLPVWTGLRSDAVIVTMIETSGNGMGYEGLYLTDLGDALTAARPRIDEVVDTLKISALMGHYSLGRYGGRYYAKAQNLRRRLRAGYDAALGRFDLLLMPVMPMAATPHPEPGSGPEAIARRSWEVITNTAPFNATGHPAISVPCGLADDRPIGLMLVGRHWDEATIYRAAAAFEASGDWRGF